MPTRSSHFSEIVLTPLFVLLMCAMVEESSQILSKPSPDECLRKCDLAREESSITKVTRFLACYQKCLSRNKEDRTALSKIISRLRTRKALPTTNCPGSSEDHFVKWKPSEVNVSFGQYENTSSWYVNISWTPFNDTLENCTGILVRLAVPGDLFASPPDCSLHPTNQTFLRRNLSQYNYRYPDAIFLDILALPHSSDFSGEMRPRVPNIPTSPSQTTTTATSPPPSASKCFREYGDLVWYPAKVNVDFVEGSEKNGYANISWTPLTDPTVLWTGYLISVFVGDIRALRSSKSLQCFKLPKNQSYLIVDASLGWKDPQSISVNVTAYPRPQLEVADLKYFSPVNSIVKHTMIIPDSPEPVSSSPNPTKPVEAASPNPTKPVSSSPNPTKPVEAASPNPTKPVSSSPNPTKPVEAASPNPTKPAAAASSKPTTGKPDVVKTVFLSVGGCAVLIIAVVLFRRWRRPWSWWRPWSLFATKAPESRKIFKHHAFIIYSMFDSEWVDDTLIPSLESHGFKCCVHWRDFLPGKAVTENIVESVYNSFKIIAVVSAHFMNSAPCDFELNHAATRLMKNRDDCLIVIKLDDAGVQRLPISILKNSYIDFTRATDRSTWESKLAAVLNEAVVEDDTSRASTTRTTDKNNRLSDGSSTASEGTELICSCQSA